MARSRRHSYASFVFCCCQSVCTKYLNVNQFTERAGEEAEKYDDDVVGARKCVANFLSGGFLYLCSRSLVSKVFWWISVSSSIIVDQRVWMSWMRLHKSRLRKRMFWLRQLVIIIIRILFPSSLPWCFLSWGFFFCINKSIILLDGWGGAKWKRLLHNSKLSN